MIEGLITRSLGGFYNVQCPDGSLLDCRGQGHFRKEGITLLVGDHCTVEATEPGKGSIVAIAPRKNDLQRPPLANLDRLALVLSLAEPAPNALIIDQLTAIAARRNIPVVMIFTKPDLASPEEWVDIYRGAGYPVVVVNNLTGEGRDEASALLCGGVTAFCGNSGAGKSSLMNTLFPQLTLATAPISQKLGRGRHTTRHVELYPNGQDGYLADTPGFSSLDLKQSEKMLSSELAECFPEFREYLPHCRFNGCSHRTEQGCAVLEAVNSGVIPRSRHRSYCAIYESIKDLRAWELTK